LLWVKCGEWESIQLIESAETTSPSLWYVGEKGQIEMKSGRMKEVGSRIVGVGDIAQVELRGESGEVDEGDKVGELEVDKGNKVRDLLDKDMLP
jgi:hypothetical protein